MRIKFPLTFGISKTKEKQNMKRKEKKNKKGKKKKGEKGKRSTI